MNRPIEQQDETAIAEERRNLHARIDRDYKYQPPKGDQPQRYQKINEQVRDTAHLLVNLCPPGRDLSLALTELESARMRANKAIATGED